MVTCRLAVAEQPGRARDGHLSLAALLAGAEPLVGSAPRPQPVADVLAALTAGLIAIRWPVRLRPWPGSGTGSVCRSQSTDHAIGGTPCSPRCCPPEPRPPRPRRRCVLAASPPPRSPVRCPPRPSNSHTTRSAHQPRAV